MGTFADYNNIGVDFYRQGRLLEARASFVEAAKLLHLVASQEVPGHVADANGGKEAFAAPTCIAQVTAKEDEFIDSKSGDGSPFFARNVHKIEKISTSKVSSAAIINNIALTYLPDNKETSQVYALNLFELAYILVVQTEAYEPCAEAIALNCLNNAAHIQFLRGNHSLAQQYMNALILYIKQLPLTHDQARKEFRSRVMLNALCVQNSFAAQAA